MAKNTAKIAEKKTNQIELFYDSKRDLNPFWTSSLFSDVYLKNDLPRDYKNLWDNDEVGGFYNFYQGFLNLCHDVENEAILNWREADTVRNWIVPVMNLLGWENNSERLQSSFIDNTSFTVEENGKKQVYRPDLIYFDFPQHKAYTQKEKESSARLREIRDKKTGAKIVLEAKYWDRLSGHQEKTKNKESDDSASGLGPELQTLKYMDLFTLDFGILTDGKTWKLFHKELSTGMDRRNFEFDLGNLKELALNIYSENNEQKFRSYAKYFYYFFCKESLVQSSQSKSVPFVYEVLEYSKRYANSIEEDLKKRFIITMGVICNSLKKSAIENNSEVDLETIRNVAESHLFNILFTKSCEVRKILPIQSINYLKVSLHEIIEYMTEMRFDPDKDLNDFLRDFQYGEAFGGKKFSYSGFDIFNRFINLYEIIHDGTSPNKDFGFEIAGFKESIFSKEEWAFAKKHKINNKDMISILFNLNFIESASPDRKFQQIPYSYFTPRQLGSIYESFLEYRLESASSDMVFTKGQWKEANLKSSHVKNLKLSDHHTVVKGQLFFSPDNEERKMTGAFYTPDAIVNYIVKHSLAPLVEKMHSSEILNLKICDPAMGSGHFLSGVLDYLVEQYRLKWSEENNNDCDESMQETSRKILDECIFGVDINQRAVKLAKMSLWLVTAYAGKKLERLNDQLKVGNSLTDFSWKTEFRNVFKLGGFSAIIGNPPYGAKLEEKDKDYIDQYYKSQGYQLDSYLLFIEKSMRDLLKPNGRLGFIVPSPWMTNLKQEAARKFIFQDTFVSQIVNLNYKVFKDATVDTQIILLDNLQNKNSALLVKVANCEDDLLDKKCKTILHDQNLWASQYIEPVNMFTSHSERALFTKISNHSQTLNDIAQTSVGIKPYQSGKGTPKQTKQDVEQRVFDSLTKKNNLYRRLIRGADINKYSMNPKTTVYLKFGPWIAEPRMSVDWESKHKILVRQTGDSIIATLDESKCLCMNNLHIVIVNDDSYSSEFVLGVLNSSLIDWYYYMLNPEKGEALAEVKKSNLANLPIPIAKKFDKSLISKVEIRVKKLLSLNQVDNGKSLELRNEIDKIVFEVFGLSDSDIEVIKEFQTLYYSLKGVKAVA